ncbi:MAG: FtsX-like permease family protein [Candidatus Binatia bacterium]
MQCLSPTSSREMAGKKGDLVASQIDQIDVRLRPGTETQTAEAALGELLGPGFHASTPLQRRLVGEHTVEGLRATLVGMSSLALLAAVFIIYASTTTMVVQRLPAMATLVTLGAGPRDLVRAVIAEAAMLGAIGSGVGVGLFLASFIGEDADRSSTSRCADAGHSGESLTTPEPRECPRVSGLHCCSVTASMIRITFRGFRGPGRLVVRANARTDKAPVLLGLREEIEELKAMIRLCHDSKGYAGIAAFEHGARLVVEIAKQNEGWLKSQSSQVQPEQPAAPCVRVRHVARGREIILPYLTDDARSCGPRDLDRPCLGFDDSGPDQYGLATRCTDS